MTELPEPAVQASSIIPRNGIYGALYTAEQMRDYGRAEYLRGLEDAASLSIINVWAGMAFAEKIRALKEQT
jgi:hypothetical protein